MVKRKKYWQGLLFDAVRAAKECDFKYGKHDCCLAAANIVQAVTDVDLMEDFRGKYRSAAGAARLIKAEGCTSLTDAVGARIMAAGGEAIGPAYAATGDIVMTDKALHDQVQGEAVGICVGRKFLFPGEKGWINLRRSDLIAVFRIAT
jgi:hypothetical protein